MAKKEEKIPASVLMLKSLLEDSDEMRAESITILKEHVSTHAYRLCVLLNTSKSGKFNSVNFYFSDGGRFINMTAKENA